MSIFLKGWGGAGKITYLIPRFPSSLLWDLHNWQRTSWRGIKIMNSHFHRRRMEWGSSSFSTWYSGRLHVTSIQSWREWLQMMHKWRSCNWKNSICWQWKNKSQNFLIWILCYSLGMPFIINKKLKFRCWTVQTLLILAQKFYPRCSFSYLYLYTTI